MGSFLAEYFTKYLFSVILWSLLMIQVDLLFLIWLVNDIIFGLWYIALILLCTLVIGTIGSAFHFDCSTFSRVLIGLYQQSLRFIFQCSCLRDVKLSFKVKFQIFRLMSCSRRWFFSLCILDICWILLVLQKLWWGWGLHS